MQTKYHAAFHKNDSVVYERTNPVKGDYRQDQGPGRGFATATSDNSVRLNGKLEAKKEKIRLLSVLCPNSERR